MNKHYLWIIVSTMTVILLFLAFAQSGNVQAQSSYPVTVKLLDSGGSGLAGGLVEYWNSSSWQTLGTTDSNGEVSGSIPVVNTDIRMTYEYVTNRIWNVDIPTNPILTFNTRDVLVTLKTCEGVGLEGGVAEYQSGYWRPIGTTDSNGEIHKEMLPANLNFKMTYAYGANRFYQDTAVDPSVDFTTTKVTGIYDHTIEYRSGLWRPFTQPTMEMMPGTYEFRFRSADGTIREYVTISDCETTLPYTDTNSPPVCEQARASSSELWPPNHQMVGVNVLGVTDPDGDPVSLTINSIYQDEPVDATGDGAFAPDGMGVGTSTAWLRAERDGGGNGRVYHIGFSADDGNGGTCTGFVTASVPKSMGKKGAAVDDGALYDSTVP